MIDTQQPNAAPAGHGLGSLSVDLLPGIYRVRASAGLQIWEKLVELSSGGVENVSVPLLDFASPIPLPGTAQTHEYHTKRLSARAIGCMSTRATAARSSFSPRRWAAPPRAMPFMPRRLRSPIRRHLRRPRLRKPSRLAKPVPNPALGLSLRNLAGEPVADLKGRSVVETDPDRDPGLPATCRWIPASIDCA